MAITSEEAKNVLNTIDISLKESFNNVSIEKIDTVKENYFKIEVSDYKYRNENKICPKVIVHIKEHSIAFGNGSSLMWEYVTNPINESSQTIQRISTVNTFTTDIETIVLENRFNKEYLDYLTEQLSINESNNNTEEGEDSDFNDGSLFEFQIDENVSLSEFEQDGTICERYKVGTGELSYNAYKVKVDDNIHEVSENLIIPSTDKKQ